MKTPISISCKNGAERVRRIFSSGKQLILRTLHIDDREGVTSFCANHQYNPVTPAKVSSTIEHLSKNEISKNNKIKKGMGHLGAFTHAEQVSLEKVLKKTTASSSDSALMHTHQCCVNQKHPSIPFYESVIAKGSQLNSARVQNWNLKEQLLVARKLKTFCNLENLSIHESVSNHEITLIKKEIQPAEDDSFKENLAQNEHWQEALLSKERYRQIGQLNKN